MSTPGGPGWPSGPGDPLHSFTLADVLREHARSWPERIALVGPDGFRVSYAEMDVRTNRLAQALAARGVGPGGRLLWLGQNDLRLLEALLAAAKLGAVLCPANWRQSADEFGWLLTDFDPAVVFWQRTEVGEPIAAARAAVGGRGWWIAVDQAATEGGDPGYEDVLAGADYTDPDGPVEPASPVLAMYTAAFTGRPAAALLSHAGLLVQNLCVALVQGITADEVYLN
ncbi:MAG: AMP-binding protein, partial [Mycobacteriales bacterium]